jgi:hypothetical protein
MPVTRRRVSKGRSGGGFGVLEVLVSSAILGTVVVATTACVTQALAERADQHVRREAVAAVDAEVERLRALRFAPEPPPAGLDDDGLAPGSALGELFPHARPQDDHDAARCVTVGDSAGAVCFERVLRFDWGELVLSSRFVEVSPLGLVTVNPEVDDDGWAVWSGEEAPSGALAVVATAVLSDRSWSFAVTATLTEGR